MDFVEFSGSKDGQLDQAHSHTMRHDHWGIFDTSLMSEEERKIRDELETEIERDLEEEIKDGICRLALQLHKLFQHKKGRIKSSSSTHRISSNDEISTEVNITIMARGGCKVTINESDLNDLNMIRPQSSRSEAKQGRVGYYGKHFDRSKTLCMGPSSIATADRNQEVLDQVTNNKKNTYANLRHFGKEERNRYHASSQHGKVLGWKY